MKNTMRKAMLSTIAMLVVAVMSLTGVTYAWFSAAETADVTGIQMNVAAADGGFQISTSQNGPWVSSIDLSDPDEDPLSVKPVSTVNAETFFTAEVNSNDLDQIKTAANTGNNVLTKTIYAKNTGDTEITIKLANSGALIDSDESTTDTPVFGDITDGVKNSAAAARVAIFVDDRLAYIFGDEATYGVNGAYDTYFDFRGADRDTAKTADQGVVTNPTNATFTIAGRNVETGADKVVKIDIVVWLEGQDAQCENVNANSAFTVDLDFAIVK